jgi:hypothetical protein
MSGITNLDWKPVRRNTLCGFACVKIERINLRVDDVAIHQKGNSRWASMPSKPMMDRNGAVLRDETTGKIRYQPLLQWADRKTADRFNIAVVAELLARFPEAFAGEPSRSTSPSRSPSSPITGPRRTGGRRFPSRRSPGALPSLRRRPRSGCLG